MQPETNKILECVRDVLARRVAGSLPPGRSASLLKLVDAALSEILSRSSDRLELVVESHTVLDEFIAEGRNLIGDSKDLKRESGPGKISAPTFEYTQLVDESLRTELTELVERVIDQLQMRTDLQWIADARSWVGAIMRYEAHLAARLNEAPPLKSPVAAITDFDTDAFAAYLQQRLGLGKIRGGLTINRIPGGFSRETLLIAIELPDGGTREVVVRKEKRNGIIAGVGLPLSREFPMLRLASDYGLAVPAPLWFEGNKSILGDAFTVVEKVPGALLGTAVEATGINAENIRQIAHALGKLHSIPWIDRAADCSSSLMIPASATLTIKDAFVLTLDRWVAYLRAARAGSSPALAAALRWLRRNIPDRALTPALVHGDVGFHNILFERNRLTAILDWELADLGDPARDIANIFPAIRSHVSWEQFLAWYQEGGGGHIPYEVAEFYQVFLAAVGLIIVRVAWASAFAAGDPPEIEYLELGRCHAPHYYDQLHKASNPIWR